MIIDVTGKLAVDLNVREWCKFPYPGHNRGCPNYGISETCPPKVGTITEIFDLGKPHWLAIIEFNIKQHADKMKGLHPQWSDKQCRCCLYWQNTVRKDLRKMCDDFIYSKNSYDYTLIPEAMGVNVFRTAHRLGIMLRKNINDKLYKIALIGRTKTDNGKRIYNIQQTKLSI